MAEETERVKELLEPGEMVRGDGIVRGIGVDAGLLQVIFRGWGEEEGVRGREEEGAWPPPPGKKDTAKASNSKTTAATSRHVQFNKSSDPMIIIKFDEIQENEKRG